MKTTKPQSTISYNTFEFLKLKLNDLLRGHYIQFWAFIHHLPEVGDATGGKKEHFHVYVEPSSRKFDTDEFREYFREIDLKNVDLPPLCCITLHPVNSFTDWYLYGLHDKEYLESKLLTRQYHYVHSDFVTSDDNTFTYLVSLVDYSNLKTFQRFKDLVSAGMNFNTILNAGFIPINQLIQYREAFRYLSPLGYEPKSADPRYSAQNRQKDPSNVDDNGKPLFDLEVKY